MNDLKCLGGYELFSPAREGENTTMEITCITSFGADVCGKKMCGKKSRHFGDYIGSAMTVRVLSHKYPVPPSTLICILTVCVPALTLWKKVQDACCQRLLAVKLRTFEVGFACVESTIALLYMWLPLEVINA